VESDERLAIDEFQNDRAVGGGVPKPESAGFSPQKTNNITADSNGREHAIASS
jgi:hypothetical protein